MAVNLLLICVFLKFISLLQFCALVVPKLLSLLHNIDYSQPAKFCHTYFQLKKLLYIELECDLNEAECQLER